MLTDWLVSAIESRMRCKVLALELRALMGNAEGRRAVWCCRFLAFIPSNPGYETLLMVCVEWAKAGRVG
jgi:hypothetical protein